MAGAETTEAAWDVIVIGGGPAGSTAATTLAKAGRRVLVLEKSKFPRFHVGESLLPYNRKILDELGVWPKIAASGFMLKRGAQFLMGNGPQKVRLNFSKGSFTEFPESLQVERAKFDDVLLHHSRECGAEVREESTVLEHRVTNDRASVKYRAADGSEHEVSAAFLMDASGLSNLTANREALREFYPGHKKVAIFSHYSGVKMTDGEEKGDILIVRRENSWFWLIPLEDNKTSVGLVLDLAEFKAMGKEPQQVFDEAVASTRTVQSRFTEAVALTSMHVAMDFSYQNKELVAPRVVRVGDASGFVDPVFSSGVLLAMASGRDGARVVDEALKKGQAMTSAMKRYERETRRRVAQYWEFIENFYQLHFAQLLFQPVNRFRMMCSINAVLAGCTDLSFSAWWRLRVFFLIVWLNKRMPLAKRIAIR